MKCEALYLQIARTPTTDTQSVELAKSRRTEIIGRDCKTHDMTALEALRMHNAGQTEGERAYWFKIYLKKLHRETADESVETWSPRRHAAPGAVVTSTPEQKETGQ